MPLLKLDRLCEGLEDGDWAGFLRAWDRALRAGNHPETTRYNYLLADAAQDPTLVTAVSPLSARAARHTERIAPPAEAPLWMTTISVPEPLIGQSCLCFLTVPGTGRDDRR
jgi:hypothetical protein